MPALVLVLVVAFALVFDLTNGFARFGERGRRVGGHPCSAPVAALLLAAAPHSCRAAAGPEPRRPTPSAA